MVEKLKLVELCAGTGAFSLGFDKKNVKTIFANDIDSNSKKIFDENFSTKLTLSDIHNLDIKTIPTMDILTSGFPCQPFSLAGKKKGFNDSRSNVFFKILEIMNFHKPKCVILENVKNIITHNKGETFEKIKDSISEINYTFKYKILNTSKFTNIPHNRERVYIVCFLNPNHTEKFNFPNESLHTIQLKDFSTLNDGDGDADDKYYYKNTLKVYNVINDNIKKHINTNTIYQYRRHYIRENKNNVCPTLTANMGSGGHNVPLLKNNKGIRKLTPRECFDLQGFPKNYKFPIGMSDSALYKLAGNAVTVSVVKNLSIEIIKLLR